MEVYTLDSLLRRENVVDKFESLIWTERFAAAGDFELTLHSTLASRTLFKEGTQIAINESYRVMTVETIQDNIDADGKAMLTLRGSSLEVILADRVGKSTLSDTTSEPKWVLTGTPGNIAREVFNHICILGSLDPGDVIPFYTPGSIFAADTIGEPTTSVTIELDIQSVYLSLIHI